jgi:hypothetical protein
MYYTEDMEKPSELGISEVGRREKVRKGTGEAGVDPYYTLRASQHTTCNYVHT